LLKTGKVVVKTLTKSKHIQYTLNSGIATAIPAIIFPDLIHIKINKTKVSWKEMASMATTQTPWLNVARLRDNIAGYGHAMPICWGGLSTCSEVGMFNTSRMVFAQGSSVPIYVGSPPAHFREDE